MKYIGIPSGLLDKESFNDNIPLKESSIQIVKGRMLTIDERKPRLTSNME